jgi:hypothetical protein
MHVLATHRAPAIDDLPGRESTPSYIVGARRGGARLCFGGGGLEEPL